MIMVYIKYNMEVQVLLVDDGSGTGTQQLVQLQQSTDGDEQQVVYGILLLIMTYSSW